MEINKTAFNLTENSTQLDSGTILSFVNKTFTIGTPLGTEIKIIKVANDSLLTIVAAFSPSYENSSLGLVGKWNGNMEDDFTLPNGTVLPIDMSESEIFYKFGEECEFRFTHYVVMNTNNLAKSTVQKCPDCTFLGSSAGVGGGGAEWGRG